MRFALPRPFRKHRKPPIGPDDDGVVVDSNALEPSNDSSTPGQEGEMRGPSSDTPRISPSQTRDSESSNHPKECGSPCGMKEVVHQSPDDPNCLDIVAIHGLNGHRDKTWIDKTTRLNWLEDESCLRKDIPTARILTFGYNSRTYFSRSTSDVRDFSSELLAAIKVCRKTLVEQQRPLIFLCHSLGGLVFKQAVIRAHEYNEHYSTILDNIRGVVFFATPHHGSDLAFWEEIGTTLVQIGTFGQSTNAKLPKDLKVDGNLLKSISESFSHRGGQFKIRSFYETERMKGLYREVVKKESAILGWPNELAIAASAHHSDICKFPSPSHQRYQNTISAIYELIDDMEDNHLSTESAMHRQHRQQHVPFDQREMECLRELTSDYDGHLGQVEDPAPGTCEWVLSHEKWCQWDSMRDPALLWITADAGCGKSVIAKFLANYFISQEEPCRRRHICYFFFKEGLETQDNASKAVSTILHQLCSSQRHLIEHVVGKHASIPPQLFNRFSSLWLILMAITKDPTTKDIVWILDGLDECERKTLQELIMALAAYFDSTPRASGASACCFKVIILSRPHNFIQQKLRLQRRDDPEDLDREPGVERLNKMRLVAEEESVAIAKDIGLFVRSKMVEFSQNSELVPGVLQRLEEKLISGADFTFLWISLVIKLVEDTEVDGISMLQLESILNTTNLDDVYERFLSERVLPLKTRKALMLVLAAVRPLTLSEMCAAIEIRQDHFPKPSNDAQAQIRLDKHDLAKIDLRKRPKVGPSLMAQMKMAKAAGGNSEDATDQGPGGVKHGDRKYDNAHVLRAGSNDADATVMSSLDDLRDVLRKPFSNHLRQICGHFLRIRGRKVYLVHQTAREFLLDRTVNAGPAALLRNEPTAQAASFQRQEKASTDGSRGMQPSTGISSPKGWRHSIRLQDANRYLLGICADYIQLFPFEKSRKKAQLETEDIVVYLKECCDDPPRAFFKYAAFHWIDHYRPIRHSLDFSFDYLLTPSGQHFKTWIFVHPSWIPEEERNMLEAEGIPIRGSASEHDKKPHDEEIPLPNSLDNSDRGAERVESVIEHFNLSHEAEMELYRHEYLTGDRYWKKHEDQYLKHVDLSDSDSGGDEEGDTVGDPGLAGIESWNLPDRVQFFKRQNRRKVLETFGNPFSPAGANPTSLYSVYAERYAKR